ncbi:uncharacterized protein LOC108674525 isoform X2 [Hyalella azteca]|uniref:Uncharacterized protein LOC108674525 isoform X2 n=1 Tax=Hyalella azteca TaxID=294128 RepID=A0A979FSU1_HYAAZ|nr:uncharacterized protein LOC108674525 isoform X2 [Hyalella azteca]
MTRALMLLIVAAAVSSAAGLSNACIVAFWLRLNDLRAAINTCLLQYQSEMEKSVSNPKCNYELPAYDAATCDPFFYNFNKCVLKSKGLLKPNNTLDDVALQKVFLQNKCSNDANFAKAYPTCKSSTMQRLNFLRLEQCLLKAVP